MAKLTIISNYIECLEEAAAAVGILELKHEQNYAYNHDNVCI